MKKNEEKFECIEKKDDYEKMEDDIIQSIIKMEKDII